LDSSVNVGKEDEDKNGDDEAESHKSVVMEGGHLVMPDYEYEGGIPTEVNATEMNEADQTKNIGTEHDVLNTEVDEVKSKTKSE
jgi:hypothetical protein